VLNLDKNFDKKKIILPKKRRSKKELKSDFVEKEKEIEKLKIKKKIKKEAFDKFMVDKDISHIIEYDDLLSSSRAIKFKEGHTYDVD
jgi:hypothetical protein